MAIEPTLDKFIEDISKQMRDEKSAYEEYQNLARFAEGLGFSATASILKDISEDEKRHHILLGQIIDRIPYTSELPGAKLKRPFPQIYDDWADLGVDIGARDPSIVDKVHAVLSTIYAHGPGEELAKSWLTSKGEELGL